MKQIKRLVKWEIISISDFEEKDREELEHQIGVVINSRTKTFRLTEKWVEKIYSLSYDEIVENRRK